MPKSDKKRDVYESIQEYENKWKEEKKSLLEDKRNLQKQIRELKKELEVRKNTSKLHLRMKEEELSFIKEAVCSKIKGWDENYGNIEEERNELAEKLNKLEGNLSLTKKDGIQRLQKLKDEKTSLIDQLNKEHDNALERQKVQLQMNKQKELEKEVEVLRAEFEKETGNIIEKQRLIWENEIARKEKELLEQQEEWQAQFEKQRIELEKREKEYLQDLLDKFKKS